MKNFFRPFMIVAVAASLFATSSCTKTCDAGYEGTDCKTETRAGYYGTYTLSGTDTDGDSYSNWNTTVSAGSTAPFDLNFTVIANGSTVLFTGKLNESALSTFGVNSFTFAGEGFTGSGSFSGKTLNLQLVNTAYTINLSGTRP